MTISAYEPSVVRQQGSSLLATIFHAIAALPGRLVRSASADELDGMGEDQLAELGLGRSVEPARWLDGATTALPAATAYHPAPRDR